jgi:5-aminolevulinate synthase
MHAWAARGLDLARAPAKPVNRDGLGSASQILPPIVGDAGACERIADRLIDAHGIYLQPIDYPTVPRGLERVRITPTALHSDAMVAALAAAVIPELHRERNRRAAQLL